MIAGGFTQVSESKPIRVAVIGGGCAAMAAAFELSRPEHEGRYEVTVHQVGFRLGGKGASGRGPADRIEEHGFHIWMGWYENAFRLMRECYDELDRDPTTCRIAEWTDAFHPDREVGVMEDDGGKWTPWAGAFPPQPGQPGDPIDRYRPFTVVDYLVRASSLLRHLLLLAQQADASERLPACPATTPPTPQELTDNLRRALRYGGLLTAAALIEWLRTLETIVSGLNVYGNWPALRILDLVASSAQAVLAASIGDDAELKRVWACFDIVLAGMRGCVRQGLAFDPRGFEAIDDQDCREWLMMHGAAKESVDSAFVRGLHDLAFAYAEAHPDRPSISAAQAMRGAIRVLWTYRGALFYKMQAGMGDVVFAPLHEVLSRRGVRFEFFHRLENVCLGDDDQGAHVAALEFDVQARVKGGGEFQPLIDVDGLPCWPSGPDLSQLEGADFSDWDFESHWDDRRVDTLKLKAGEDFDLVVLGVGLGAIPHVCSELLERDQRWRDLCEKVKTVATQSVQLWMRDSMEELGWPGDRVNMTSFVKPFETWADMTHLVKEEKYPARVRSIAYLASAIATGEAPPRSDRNYPERERLRVRGHAIDFLSRDVGAMWRRATDENGFRWGSLLSTEGDERREDESAIDTQYVRVNVNPSDRYVLSVPGSARFRISPLDDTYDNLTVCGDWTDCSFNGGCVEAAVMSGLLAAHAICGSPRLEHVVGYDHP